MNTYIALFRGINVGRTRSLPMKDLIRILEGLGYQDIRTYIQSGNVVMRRDGKPTADDAVRISDAVGDEFGFSPNVLLLTQEELASAVEGNPFPTGEGKQLHFIFLDSEPESPDLDTLQAVKEPTEQFRLDGKVFYLYTPGGFGISKLAEKVERCLGVSATARNFNTVSAIMKLI